MTRIQKSQINVLLVGADTAGYLSALAEGFHECGVNVVDQIQRHPFGYKQDSKKKPLNALKLVMPVSFFSQKFTLKTRWICRRIMGNLISCLRIPKAIYFYRKCDVIILNSGNTITGHLADMKLIQLLKKRLIIPFHGSDCRPAYLNGVLWRDLKMDSQTIYLFCQSQKKKIKYVEKYADVIISWLGTTHFFSRPLYLHEQLGFPLSALNHIETTIETEHSPEKKGKNLRIVHIPSKPGAKGTSEIGSIVDEIIFEGFNIEYELLTGLDNKKVIEELKRSDILIDQIFSDSASGVLVAEAALCRTPAIIAGIHASWFREFLNERFPQTFFVETSEVKDALIKMIDDNEFRRSIVDSSRSYFSSYWRPTYVAQEYLQIIQDEQQEKAIFPTLLNTPRGGFAPIAEISEHFTNYVNTYGKDALGLNHNPKLVEAIFDKYYLEKI